ncbi:hypothetical protein PN36_23620 [Candidatus Thiomargarita nelsonii]|uniref:ABC transporter permease n=1 Tax=Candidatus Thiomargarita nelsonii TaxID=1003181 RepID=A0A0A6P359_9GAMM|nr:hypothetical protein PN36_23620 [Candidatus Thiomargarita nelsonii]
MKWLGFAYKNVIRNRRRSLMTIIITAVGTASILISSGFALYTYDSLREMSARESGHVVIAHSKYFNREEESPMEYGLSNHETLKEAIEQDERIRMAIPRLQFSGLITNGDKSVIFTGTGVEPEREFDVKGPFLNVLTGKILSTELTPDPQVMLAKNLAKQLNADIGSSLTLLTTTTDGVLNALDVQVQGTFSIGVPELDKRLLFVALPTAQELLVTNKVSTLSVYLYETEETAKIEAILAKQYPELAMQPWWEQAYFYFKVKDLYNRIFGILGAMILLIVFFAVTNTLSMTVVERTRETGTLLALGTLPRQIVRNFVLEGMIMGIAGALLGILFAAGTSISLFFIDIQMPPPPGRSETYPLYIYMSTWLYSLTTLAVIILCIGAAWLTSHKAANKQIVEALGHV